MKHSNPWRMSLLWSESVTGVVCTAASSLRESPSGVEVARNKQMAWLLMEPNTKWVFSSQELSSMLFLHFYSSCAHPKPHFQQQSSGTFLLMLRFRCKCFFTFYFVMSSSYIIFTYICLQVASSLMYCPFHPFLITFTTSSCFFFKKKSPSAALTSYHHVQSKSLSHQRPPALLEEKDYRTTIFQPYSRHLFINIPISSITWKY